MYIVRCTYRYISSRKIYHLPQLFLSFAEHSRIIGMKFYKLETHKFFDFGFDFMAYAL